MTNNRSVYNLPVVNYNVYLPIIGYLYCMTSSFIGHYTLFHSYILYSLKPSPDRYKSFIESTTV